ncbi:MAG: N-acetylmuramoyl-L-alanine amidase [Phycisphaerales bacterium]|nr:peptidoglycan recognition protein family protein [Phycisphaerae bacterium]NNF42036.1 N-acetylmuramoyl-L-alanine amidase [Phycisphaerales bacterium]NNM26006.1 N-acetylmuramoyl-L-alanine amidase [Phycisphaerales bacterium]
MSFLGATSLVIAVLALGEGGLPGGFLIATNVSNVGASPAADPILQIDAPGVSDRWEGIVIHHLGMPAGDADRVHRLHQSYGYQGLGYHFLIGNGRGLGDGIIHVGYRWNEQLPGAHVAEIARDSNTHNRRSVGICLVGNGDRRPFTDRQMQSLISLVRRLQGALDLAPEAVHLHRDLAPELTSPGRWFEEARLREQLLP